MTAAQRSLFRDDDHDGEAHGPERAKEPASLAVCGQPGRPLTKAQRARNRRLSRARAVVEHPFLVVKRLWGHTKVRYRGLAKNLHRLEVTAALANLFMVRRQLPRIQG